jgi:hypothetical protein
MRTGRPNDADHGDDGRTRDRAQWARRRTTAQALAQRARIILVCDTGQWNTAVARERRVAPQTVCQWRQLC